MAVEAAGDPFRVVEVFADVTCPFAHYSIRRFTERRHLLGADHVRLRVRTWPLELANGEPLAADKVGEEIADLRAQVAADLFTDFVPSQFPTATVLILGTATLAYRQGIETGEAFNLAIRNALFEQGRAIGRSDVLTELAGEHGVTIPDAASARAAVDADFAEGRARGVIGSPHFFAGQQSFFCPMLDIEHQGEHLQFQINDTELDHFCDQAFG